MPELRITQKELNGLINLLAEENNQHLLQLAVFVTLMEVNDGLTEEEKRDGLTLANTCLNQCYLLEKLCLIDSNKEQAKRAIYKIRENVKGVAKTIIEIGQMEVNTSQQPESTKIDPLKYSSN